MGSKWCPKGAMGAIRLGQGHQREGFPQKGVPFGGPKAMENGLRRSNGPNSEANGVPRGVPGRHPKQGLMSGLFWGPPPNRKSVLSSRQEHSFRGRPQVLFGTLFGTLSGPSGGLWGHLGPLWRSLGTQKSLKRPQKERPKIGPPFWRALYTDGEVVATREDSQAACLLIYR